MCLRLSVGAMHPDDRTLLEKNLADLGLAPTRNQSARITLISSILPARFKTTV